jgi:nucleotide-binding universal stress UspA family protein
MTSIAHETSESAAPAPAPHIVVGYDGSEESGHALDKALAIARAGDGTLEVVTVSHVPVFYGGYPLGVSWSPVDDARAAAHGALSARFGEEIPDWVSVHGAEGSAAKILIDASEGAEMLVVGSRGHGGFAGLLLGSVSSACAEHAHCPVLVVHPQKVRDDEAEAAELEKTVPIPV